MSECDNKRKFDDFRTAENAIFGLWQKDPRVKIGDLHAYTCPRCGKIHVGHHEYYRKRKTNDSSAVANKYAVNRTIGTNE